MALVQVQETPRWKKLLSYVGPGFLVSVAYLDPGNCKQNLSLGVLNLCDFVRSRMNTNLIL